MIKAIPRGKKKHQPFVKWAGGKRGLLSQLLPLFPEKFNNYFEPFVGGGAVFFELYSLGLLEGKEVFLYDINSELVNTYNVIKKEPIKLIKLLYDYKKNHSSDFYYKIRSLDREKSFSKSGKIQRAARFIYLNKTCFNGLYRVNKKNQNNVPFGRYSNPNICDEEVIYLASEALKDVHIKNISYKNIVKYAKSGDFVYFDPPYLPLTPTANFTSYNNTNFLEDEQKMLFEIFKELSGNGCKAALSNSDTSFIKNLYNEFEIKKIKANRFINSRSKERGKINEILVRSNWCS